MNIIEDRDQHIFNCKIIIRFPLYVTIHISLISHISFLGVKSGPHERRLINDLLERYQNLERPVFNESEPLNLKFGLTLLQIIDVVSISS